jgi:poly-gamma-glutamate synthesis protein (capsule biosynthesis protein)
MIGLLISHRYVGEEAHDDPVTAKVEIDYQVAQPLDLQFFETAYAFPPHRFDFSGTTAAAGVIPHHLLAADLIADFFRNLEGADYDTVILIGPNHFLTGSADIITSARDWQTPYGILAHDERALQGMFTRTDIPLGVDEEAMSGEHAINSEVSFIRKTFPRVRILPFMLKPSVDPQTATAFADALFQISQEKKVLLLASVDFSHYKTSEEAQQDDARSLAAIAHFEFPNIYQIEADSRPAIYALLKFSAQHGAAFHLLDNSNSALLSAQPNLESTTSYVTGYFTVGSIAPQKSTLMFAGDIMLSRAVGDEMQRRGDWRWPFLLIADETRMADILFGNLEGPISDTGEDAGAPYSFRAHPRAVEGLTFAGFDVLSVANNHIGDWGRSALEDTLNILNENNIAYAGGGFNEEEAHEAKVIEVHGTRFGFLAYTPYASKSVQATTKQSGITAFTVDAMIRDIESAKQSSDAVIVSLHYGDEYSKEENAHQQKWSRAAIDAGANLVIGHHPHVPQRVERYKEGYIAYSLGNFVFDQTFSQETMNGMLLKVDFEGSNISEVAQVPTGISKSFQAVITEE